FVGVHPCATGSGRDVRFGQAVVVFHLQLFAAAVHSGGQCLGRQLLATVVCDPPRDFQVRAFLLPLPVGVGHVLDAGAQCGSELVRSGVPRVAEPEPVVLPCDRRVGGGTAGLVAAAAAVGGAACQCDGTHGHEYGRAGGAHGEGASRPWLRG